MRQALRLAPPALAAAVLAAMPTGAADYAFGGTIDLRAGYGSNPYLFSSSPGGSALVGGTATALVGRQTAYSQTTLSGSVDLDHHFAHYGTLDNYFAQLSHVQRVTSRLTLNGDASYADTINPRDGFGTTAAGLATITPATAVNGATVIGTPGALVPTTGYTNSFDLLTIGRRSRRIAGDLGASWAPTERDTLQASISASRSTYPNRGISDYKDYGGSLSYLRTISARTKVGVQFSASYLNPGDYANSHSYYASVRLVQQFSAIWQFDGSVGTSVNRGAGSGRGATLGFNALLCGAYPRYTLCFSGSRQSAPSGIGGLRTDLLFGASLDYRLSARSRINLSGTFDNSSARSSIALPRQRYYSASGSYSHDLTERLAVGGSARYQRRDFGAFNGFPSSRANGYSVTADITYRFGRLPGQ